MRKVVESGRLKGNVKQKSEGSNRIIFAIRIRIAQEHIMRLDEKWHKTAFQNRESELYSKWKFGGKALADEHRNRILPSDKS